MRRLQVGLAFGVVLAGLAAASQAHALSIVITATEVAANSWELTIEADVVIGDGALGVANAVTFTPNASATDTFFSCAFQTCGTQGPGAVGSGVLANAVYFQWAGAGTTGTPFAFGNNVGSPQLMATFTSSGPVGLTFSGVNALFGNDESQPFSDFNTFQPISVAAVTLQVVPEPGPATLLAMGLGAIVGRRWRGAKGTNRTQVLQS